MARRRQNTGLGWDGGAEGRKPFDVRAEELGIHGVRSNRAPRAAKLQFTGLDDEVARVLRSGPWIKKIEQSQGRSARSEAVTCSFAFLGWSLLRT